MPIPAFRRALAASAVLAGLAAAPAHAGDAASLAVAVSNIAPQEGYLMIALFAGEADYAADRARVSTRLAVTAATVEARFEGLAPGAYALKIFHDVNGDGKLNMNAFGIPTEPILFSNNAPVRFGPPGWSAASFAVAAGDNAHAIRFE